MKPERGGESRESPSAKEKESSEGELWPPAVKAKENGASNGVAASEGPDSNETLLDVLNAPTGIGDKKKDVEKQLVLILEGEAGVAHMGPNVQQEFEEWLQSHIQEILKDTNVKPQASAAERAAPQRLMDLFDVKVALSFMQELPAPPPDSEGPSTAEGTVQNLKTALDPYRLGFLWRYGLVLLCVTAVVRRFRPRPKDEESAGAGEVSSAELSKLGVVVKEPAAGPLKGEAARGETAGLSGDEEQNAEPGKGEGELEVAKRKGRRQVAMVCKVMVEAKGSGSEKARNGASVLEMKRTWKCDEADIRDLTVRMVQMQVVRGDLRKCELPSLPGAAPRVHPAAPTGQANPAFAVADVGAMRALHSALPTVMEDLAHVPSFAVMAGTLMLDIAVVSLPHVASVLIAPTNYTLFRGYVQPALTVFGTMRFLTWLDRQGWGPMQRGGVTGLFLTLAFGTLMFSVIDFVVRLSPIVAFAALPVSFRTTVINNMKGANAAPQAMQRAAPAVEAPQADALTPIRGKAGKEAKGQPKGEPAGAEDQGIIKPSRQKLNGRQSYMTLPYSGFRQIVEQGGVKKVDVLADDILRCEIKPWFLQKQPKMREAAAETMGQFYVLIPPEYMIKGDRALWEGLLAQGIGFEAVQQAKPRWWVEVATSMVLPSLVSAVVLFGVLYLFQERQMGGLRRQDPKVGKNRVTQVLSDVAGCDEVKEELEEVVHFLTKPRGYAEMGARAPRGVLMVGPPGTGKTLLARAVAGSSNASFFQASASSFDDTYVGVGAKRVRELFEQARAGAPSIVFIDEIDAIRQQRHIQGSSFDSQTLNQLLTEMDGFASGAKDDMSTVVVLAATNQPENLDEALLRPGRFDRTVTVSRPNAAGRLEVLSVHARAAGTRLLRGADLALVAQRTMGFSGAALEALLNEAALLAVREETVAVSSEHLLEGIERAAAGIKRPGIVASPLERLTVAGHECGHAIISAVAGRMCQVDLEQGRQLEDPWVRDTLNRIKTPEGAGPRASPSGSSAERAPLRGIPTKVTMVPRGDAMGYTLNLQEEDKHLHSEEELRGQILMLLGGRAAERVLFKRLTSGASDDLQRASDLAEAVVGQLGMGRAVGCRVLQGRGMRYLSSQGDARAVGDAVKDSADAEILGVLSVADTLAYQILEQKRELLEAMVEELLEMEVLEGGQLQRLLTHESCTPEGQLRTDLAQFLIGSSEDMSIVDVTATTSA